MNIRPFEPGDELAICEIYNHYVTHTVVTFEERPLTPQQMRERIDAYRANHPWLVCVSDGSVVGYSYATWFHPRAAYRHSAEMTVYVRQGLERRGIGRRLYDPLIRQLQAQGCHALLAGISLPNEGSVGLHEAFGFTKVAHFAQVGHKLGGWVDVGYWQRLLP